MNNFYVCPNHNCDSTMCPHKNEHRKKDGCGRKCIGTENIPSKWDKCLKVSKLKLKPKSIPIIKILTAKNTAKATREYMRSDNG